MDSWQRYLGQGAKTELAGVLEQTGSRNNRAPVNSFLADKAQGRYLIDLAQGIQNSSREGVLQLFPFEQLDGQENVAAG